LQERRQSKRNDRVSHRRSVAGPRSIPRSNLYPGR
jgi:hypothetical protein